MIFVFPGGNLKGAFGGNTADRIHHVISQKKLMILTKVVRFLTA